MDLDKEIRRIEYELSVNIPEELQLAMTSRDNETNTEISEILTRQEQLTIRLNQLRTRKNNLNSINLQSLSKDSIDIGSVVELQDLVNGNLRIVKLLISEISDHITEYDEVTLNSPIGKLLRFKKVNDVVKLSIAGKIITYKILKFSTVHDIS